MSPTSVPHPTTKSPTAESITPDLNEKLRLLYLSQTHLLAKLGNNPKMLLSDEVMVELKKLTILIAQTQAQVDQLLKLIAKPGNGNGATVQNEGALFTPEF